MKSLPSSDLSVREMSVGLVQEVQFRKERASTQKTIVASAVPHAPLDDPCTVFYIKSK